MNRTFHEKPSMPFLADLIAQLTLLSLVSYVFYYSLVWQSYDLHRTPNYSFRSTASPPSLYNYGEIFLKIFLNNVSCKVT